MILFGSLIYSNVLPKINWFGWRIKPSLKFTVIFSWYFLIVFDNSDSFMSKLEKLGLLLPVLFLSFSDQNIKWD